MLIDLLREKNSTISREREKKKTTRHLLVPGLVPSIAYRTARLTTRAPLGVAAAPVRARRGRLGLSSAGGDGGAGRPVLDALLPIDGCGNQVRTASIRLLLIPAITHPSRWV